MKCSNSATICAVLTADGSLLCTLFHVLSAFAKKR